MIGAHLIPSTDRYVSDALRAWLGKDLPRRPRVRAFQRLGGHESRIALPALVDRNGLCRQGRLCVGWVY